MPSPASDPARVGLFKAVVFDLDGLLIDSEPLWREAEMEVFGPIGIRLTEEMCASTMGLRIDEVVEHWFRLFPWKGPGRREVERRVVERLISLVREKGAGLAGIGAALTCFRSLGLRLALASSSTHRIIEAALDRLELTDAFEVVLSADDEPAGKPDPAIYLSAASALRVPPQSCIALEDSLNGVLAAKAAGMTCIAIPTGVLDYPAGGPQADLTLGSLEQISAEVVERLALASSDRRAG